MKRPVARCLPIQEPSMAARRGRPAPQALGAVSALVRSYSARSTMRQAA